MVLHFYCYATFLDHGDFKSNQFKRSVKSCTKQQQSAAKIKIKRRYQTGASIGMQNFHILCEKYSVHVCMRIWKVGRTGLLQLLNCWLHCARRRKRNPKLDQRLKPVNAATKIQHFNMVPWLIWELRGERHSVALLLDAAKRALYGIDDSS